MDRLLFTLEWSWQLGRRTSITLVAGMEMRGWRVQPIVLARGLLCCSDMYMEAGSKSRAPSGVVSAGKPYAVSYNKRSMLVGGKPVLLL